MTMVIIAYQTMQWCDDSTVVHVLVVGFTGFLKGWWDEHLTSLEKDQILGTCKVSS